jgi:predicted nuclease of predicted toxin-antitoxin system
MTVRLYMDVHVRPAVTDGLSLRDVDVVTAQEDGKGESEDPEILDRATALARVLFTQDDDLLREAKVRQARGEVFAGLIYAHQLNITIGQCVADLELIAKATDPSEWISKTVYFPL